MDKDVNLLIIQVSDKHATIHHGTTGLVVLWCARQQLALKASLLVVDQYKVLELQRTKGHCFCPFLTVPSKQPLKYRNLARTYAQR